MGRARRTKGTTLPLKERTRKQRQRTGSTRRARHHRRHGQASVTRTQRDPTARSQRMGLTGSLRTSSSSSSRGKSPNCNSRHNSTAVLVRRPVPTQHHRRCPAVARRRRRGPRASTANLRAAAWLQRQRNDLAVLLLLLALCFFVHVVLSETTHPK